MSQLWNRHHILFDRRTWTATDTGRKLRDVPLLIPKIDVDTHKELHRACPTVPVLGHHAMASTFHNLELGRNTPETIDNLLQGIDKASRNPKAHEIERQICLLAIAAIELQRPYILEGAIESKQPFIAA